MTTVPKFLPHTHGMDSNSINNFNKTATVLALPDLCEDGIFKFSVKSLQSENKSATLKFQPPAQCQLTPPTLLLYFGYSVTPHNVLPVL